jgi:hypothetical protein
MPAFVNVSEKGFRAPVIESSRSASAVEIVEPGWGSR